MILATYDIDASRNELLSHGIEVSEVFHDSAGNLAGGFHIGTEGRSPGPDPEGRSYGSYASFKDPDGNGWFLQEIKERLPGRTSHGSLQGKSADILLEALKSAAAAHGIHEKELGKADPDWPKWYAEHMARTLSTAA
ncbi:MAG: glyoxalase/bleomycin resistance protein/dioxygenase [Acidobacteriales bacterium]|nr:glyoxalase/bleomycin resistance protein/dioxygenase [Terriglobales bacterium]